MSYGPVLRRVGGSVWDAHMAMWVSYMVAVTGKEGISKGAFRMENTTIHSSGENIRIPRLCDPSPPKLTKDMQSHYGTGDVYVV